MKTFSSFNKYSNGKTSFYFHTIKNFTKTKDDVLAKVHKYNVSSITMVFNL